MQLSCNVGYKHVTKLLLFGALLLAPAFSVESALAQEQTSSITYNIAFTSKSPITTEAKWPKKVVVVNKPVQAVIVPAVINDGSGAVLTLQGEASYYSRAGCLGCSPALRMANGQPLDDNALTMAIGANQKHLVGRLAKVTNLSNGKSVTVRITDTGGFYQAKYGHRVADLTIASRNAIGMASTGQVRVEVF